VGRAETGRGFEKVVAGRQGHAAAQGLFSVLDSFRETQAASW
jgi:hypothetical protein